MGAKQSNRFFDEMHVDGGVRPAYEQYGQWLHSTPNDTLTRKHDQADLMFRRLGITFTVYGQDEGTERLIPFDIIPRILDVEEWAYLEKGTIQRVKALNAFLHDVYHDQEILHAGVVPAELVLTNEAYQPQMLGLDLPRRTYAHIAGVDLVRVGEKDFYVLEDNVRTPSGVSYMLENRQIMMRLFPELFSHLAVAPVDAVLPFAVDYEPYSAAHVITQLQLLMFSALAFTFLMLSGIYPPELKSTNLDFDFVYRKLLPGAFRALARSIHQFDQEIRASLLNALREFVLLVEKFHGESGIFARTQSAGTMVIWMVALLFVYLLFYLI